MSKVEKYSRVIIKRNTVPGDVPTIPALGSSHDDHTLLPAWRTTDIYIGEFFLNEVDENVWMRVGENTIKQLYFIEDSGLTNDFLTDDTLYFDSSNDTLYTKNIQIGFQTIYTDYTGTTTDSNIIFFSGSSTLNYYLPSATGTNRNIKIVCVGSVVNVNLYNSDILNGSNSTVVLNQYDKLDIVDYSEGVWFRV